MNDPLHNEIELIDMISESFDNHQRELVMQRISPTDIANRLKSIRNILEAVQKNHTRFLWQRTRDNQAVNGNGTPSMGMSY
jgi:hypothetical protein